LETIVDFETFSKILNRPGGFRDPGEPEEYCRGFQVFDKDMTGFIGVGQLRYILTNLGEKMSDDEVDELLKAVDTSSGEINYTGMFDFFYIGLYLQSVWLIMLLQNLSARFLPISRLAHRDERMAKRMLWNILLCMNYLMAWI